MVNNYRKPNLIFNRYEFTETLLEAIVKSHYVLVLILVFTAVVFTILAIRVFFPVGIRWMKSSLKILNEYSVLPVIILLVSGLGAFVVIVFSNAAFINEIIKEISPEGLGQLGDFYNGLLTPAISLVSVLLLYLAFKQQFIANELFYDFELDRSYSQDLEWLRSSSSDIELLQVEISKKRESELEEYLAVEGARGLRKSVYIISKFEVLLAQIQSHKHLKTRIGNEVHQILAIFYLHAFKQIFRDLVSYVQYLKYEGKELDIDLVEFQFLLRFEKFFNLISEIDNDKLFRASVVYVRENLIKY